MGWGGGTALFDAAVTTTLKFIPVVNDSHAEIMVQAVVEEMYAAFIHSDWDTESESEYYEPYLENVLIKLGRIDPEDL